MKTNEQVTQRALDGIDYSLRMLESMRDDIKAGRCEVEIKYGPSLWQSIKNFFRSNKNED